MSNNAPVDRKRLGIFYTPSEATRILCEWAIRTPHDHILEPSFGACGFLEASRDRLAVLESTSPGQQLFGCDIDPIAFSNYLLPKFGESDPLKRFFLKDFLQVKPSSFSIQGFDAVIGNPPYVSHHNMSLDQKAAIIEMMQNASFSLGSKASLWAYFIFHSLNFLKPGGRIAWILPGSFLHAEYSNSLKETVSNNFSRSLVIQLGQRLFSSEGTDESTAVLLAEGWRTGGPTRKLEVEFAPTLYDLKNIISSWQEGSWKGKEYNNRIGYILIPNSVSEYLNFIRDELEVYTLGELADILIGIVTGANSFFVINRSYAKKWHLPDFALRPILSKFNFAKGAKLNRADLRIVAADDQRCLLVDTSEMKESDLPLRIYLWSFPEALRFTNKTFDKRTIWHQPDDGRVPDAFFPYMHQHGPRLVLNTANTTCTNTIHRVYFDSKVGTLQRKVASISILSTYSQLSAEIEGRSYGSGALKHEPSEAKSISLIMPSGYDRNTVAETFRRVDDALRCGKLEKARQIADNFVMRGIRAKDRKDLLESLSSALRDTRARRHKTSTSVKAENKHKRVIDARERES